MTRDEEIKNSAPFADWVHQGDKERNVDVGFFQGAHWADEHPDREKLFNALAKALPACSKAWICALVETIIKHWNDE